MFLGELDWSKGSGLIPVITQEVKSREVLMQAYVNKKALELTIESGFAHYFSRSRKRIWKKGETSGNIQKIVNIYIDCDGDCLLYEVEQTGVACHKGYKSCFYRKLRGKND
ncbi:MAG: phosphoribosyl-AMP cyclohydrolase [Deferribacterota bacterium]|nr:phosphoribosyl-AMP cyclohydrolase [Deferribacterota bacterium]